MLHLYSNFEGELVSADTVEQAAKYHDCVLGGEEKPRDDWTQVQDVAFVPIDGQIKRASEWAAEDDSPQHVLTTYI